MGLLKRGPKLTKSANGGPVPLAPYSAGVGPQVGPLNPYATPNVQLGVYAVPYGVPTELPALYPGMQLWCGVEHINRDYLVLTAADVPWFQQTPRSQPTVTTRDGGAPGQTFGPAEMVAAYGSVRQSRAQQAQAFASGLLGW